MNIIGSSIAFIISVVASYLVGAIPTSFIFARALKGLDIRQVGSKNAGATNVFRSVGKMAGIATLIIDILKGVLVVTLMAQFIYAFVGDVDYDFFQVFLGFAAVCGHVWPIWLGFRGGKGVSTSVGALLAISWLAVLFGVVVWVTVFLLTRYVSAASLAAAVMLPFGHIISGATRHHAVVTPTLGLLVLLSALVVYRHRSNIQRLRAGTEYRFGSPH